MKYMGITDASAAKFGTLAVKKMYIGETEVWGDYVSITTNLSGLDSDAPARVMRGSTLTIAFTPATGKQLIPASVVVTMGDVDVTEDVYNDELNQIQIPSVTNDVAITAVAGAIPSDYKPVLYLYPSGNGTGGTKYGFFDSGLKATRQTTAEMDTYINAKTNRAFMFGATNYNTSPSFCVNCSNTGGATGSVFYGNGNGDINHIVGRRFIARMSPEGYRYMSSSGSTPLKAYTNTLETFTTSGNIVFGGYQQSTSIVRRLYGRIYRFRIIEGETLLRDYIPCRRISDNFTGFYDLVNETFLTEKTTSNTERADWFTPYVDITKTLTGCTDAMITSGLMSGVINKAAIGNTWSCKHTPSSGYTFNSDEATFQVTINNEDVTSDVAVYDSTTDKWTVTLVAHWNDSISITGTAQADPNAVQSVSNPDSINNIDNPNDNEEETI